jgi:hypothetical protein
MKLKVDKNVLKQLIPTYGIDSVEPVQLVTVAMQSSEAPPEYAGTLTDAGYTYESSLHAYVNGAEKIYYIEAQQFLVWTWYDTLARTIQGTDKLVKWVEGDEKYPGGKANEFIKTYSKMTGQVVPEKPQVSKPVEAKPEDDPKFQKMDKVDQVIFLTKKKLKGGFRLPGDDLIDLYQLAKQEKSNKLMNFVKSLKPIGENIIKESDLTSLVREIIKEMITNLDERVGSLTPDPAADQERANMENSAFDVADSVWGRQNWKIDRQKTGAEGTIFKLQFQHPVSKWVWKTTDGKWKYLDRATRKWIDHETETNNPSEGVREETATGAVAGYSTPFAFKKHRTMEGITDNQAKAVALKTLTSGDADGVTNGMTKEEARTFLARHGYAQDQIQRLETPNDLLMPLQEKSNASNEDLKIATEIAKKIWGINAKDIEFRAGVSGAGMLMFRVHTGSTYYNWVCKNSRNAWFYSDYEHGTRVEWKPIEQPTAVNEESTTGGVAGYNIPAAFSKAGGSKRGLEGSESLGYTLTPEGEKQMKRHADKLYESKNKTK